MTQNKRDSMVFYRSFYEALRELPARKREAATSAIFEYAFNNIEPLNLDPVGNMIFTVAKPLIDHANMRYNNCVNNGKKGGRPRKQASFDTLQSNENKNQEVSGKVNQEFFENENQEFFEKPNQEVVNQENLNDNVNDKVNVNENINDTENAYVNENTKKEPGKAGPSTHTFGEYENVLLNGLEMARLITEFGYDGYNKSVEYLSRYIKRKPDYKSACHFEDLRGWVQDAVRKEEKAKADAQKASDAQKKYSSFADISLEDLYER